MCYRFVVSLSRVCVFNGHPELGVILRKMYNCPLLRAGVQPFLQLSPRDCDIVPCSTCHPLAIWRRPLVFLHSQTSALVFVWLIEVTSVFHWEMFLCLLRTIEARFLNGVMRPNLKLTALAKTMRACNCGSGQAACNSVVKKCSNWSKNSPTVNFAMATAISGPYPVRFVSLLIFQGKCLFK